MKRMVKNGDLIDVEPDGTITVAGKPVGGGGGGDYTAGSNIEISEAKEISLKNDITGINSLKFTGPETPVLGSTGYALKIKSISKVNDYPSIYFYPRNADSNPDRYISIDFIGDSLNLNSKVKIDARKFNNEVFAFLTKGSRVPPVPSDNGTYVLKATVSGGTITYSWVAE